MAYLGELATFDHRQHNFELFLNMARKFIVLNEILRENWSAFFLIHLSDETNNLAKFLMHPRDLQSISWVELVAELKCHIQLKKSQFADRAKFYGATKCRSESLEQWAMRLRRLAVYCNFGTESETLLRDRFVLGLPASREKYHLLRQESNALTLVQALAIAQ